MLPALEVGRVAARDPVSARPGWPGLLPLRAATLGTRLGVQGRGVQPWVPWAAPTSGTQSGLLGLEVPQGFGAGMRGPAPTGHLIPTRMHSWWP